jgi:hypothetical protein
MESTERELKTCRSNLQKNEGFFTDEEVKRKTLEEKIQTTDASL